jgi:hypothetical protein
MIGQACIIVKKKKKKKKSVSTRRTDKRSDLHQSPSHYSNSITRDERPNEPSTQTSTRTRIVFDLTTLSIAISPYDGVLPDHWASTKVPLYEPSVLAIQGIRNLGYAS